MSRLGRGLDSLINDGPESTDRSTGITTVRVEHIHPNSYQPRKVFVREKLEDLAQSLKENGMIQPIIVTKRDQTHYELIAGERRLEASKIAGFDEVPVIIRSVTKKEQLQFAIIENIQREDLNPIEEAKAYHVLHDEFSLTHAQISEIIGKDRVTISNSLRLLKLNEEVQQMLLEGKISAGHARAVLQLDGERQSEFARMVAAKGWSVRQTEKEVKRFAEDQPGKQPEEKKGFFPDLIRQVSKQLAERFNVKVSIKGNPKKGKVVFQYTNEEERIALLERLRKFQDE